MNAIYKRIALAAIIFGTMVSALMQTLLTMSLPKISHDINASAWYGWITGVYVASSTLFIPVAVKLIQKFDLRTIYSSAMIIWLLGTALVAGSDNGFEILFGRLVQGIGTAGLVPAGMEVASVIVGSQFGYFVGVMAAAQSIAIAIGAPLGGLVSGSLGWRGSLWVISGLMVIIFALAVSTLPKVSGDGVHGSKWREIWRLPEAKKVLIHSILLSGVYFALVTFVPLLLKEKYLFTTAQISVFILPLLLGTAIGALLVNKLKSFWGWIPIAWLASAIGCIFTMFPSALFVSAGGAIVSIGVGAGLTMLLLILKNELHASASAASGAIQATRNIGGAAFAIILTIPIQVGISNEVAALFSCLVLAVVSLCAWISFGGNIFVRALKR